MGNLHFTSQLNLIQLYEFLEKTFPDTNFNLALEYDKSILTVLTFAAKSDSESKNSIAFPTQRLYVFGDYTVSDRDIEVSWVKFLYSIFGEEYKKQFHKMCDEKFF